VCEDTDPPGSTVSRPDARTIPFTQEVTALPVEVNNAVGSSSKSLASG